MKNFKLLLATTAILSTGLVMNVYSAADSVNAELQASVGIISPFSFSSGRIDFGDITTVGRTADKKIRITVKPDGTIDSSTNAQIVRNPVVTPMYLGGGDLTGIAAAMPGMISDWQSEIDEITATYGSDTSSYSAEVLAEYSQYTAFKNGYSSLLDGTASGLTVGNGRISLVLTNSTFDLIADDSVDEEHTSGVSCGTVSGLVPTWKATNNEGKEMEIRFGGTFTLDDSFTPSGYAHCSGSTTVTYIYNNL